MQITIIKMLYLKVLLSSFLYIILIEAGFIQNKLFDGVVMHIDRIDTGCHGKNVPCKARIQGVTTDSTKILIKTATVFVNEGGFKKLLMTITIDRCRSKENLDTCEQYLKQSNIDLCKAFDPDNPIISNSPFYIPFEPPLKCPISKGIYNGTNISFDLAPFMLFKIDGWYWKIKNEVFSEKNKLVYCQDIEGYITTSKSKTK